MGFLKNVIYVLCSIVLAVCIFLLGGYLWDTYGRQRVYSQNGSLGPIGQQKYKEVNKYTKRIYKLSTPVFFEITPKYGSQGLIVSGTAWIFDVTQDNLGNVKTYLATNHHVVDFQQVVSQRIEQSNSIGEVSPFGSLNNFSFNVEMLLPAYQLDTGGINNRKQSLENVPINSLPSNPTEEQINTHNKEVENYLKDYSYSYMNSFDIQGLASKNVYGSSNIIRYTYENNVETQVLNLNNPGLSTEKFKFDTLTVSQIKGGSGLHFYEDPDFALITLENYRNATVPLNTLGYKTFKTEYVDKNVQLLSTRGSLLDKGASSYIGGFTGSSNFSNVESKFQNSSIWVSPSDTLAFAKEGSKKVEVAYTDGYSKKEQKYSIYKFDGLDLGHGTSGSMIMDSHFRVAGIYWGGFQNNDGFKGAAVNFSNSVLLNAWHQYCAVKNLSSYLMIKSPIV